MCLTNLLILSVMFNISYNLILGLLGLVALPKLLWQWFRFGKYRNTLLQRLGWQFPQIPSQKSTHVIWIHSVSVGETRAVIPFFQQLKKKHPDAAIYVSTTTGTGFLESKKSLPEADAHFLLPLDFSWVMHRLCNHLKPTMLILVESDFWYQLISQVKKRGVAVFLINGKISERSTKRFQLLSCFSKRLFSSIDHFCVQNEAFAKRFMQLGIPADKITVTGNLKLDIPVKSLTFPEKQTFKAQLKITDQDVVITIGSTHSPEEEWLLAALTHLPIPTLKILIVPRHPERFASVAAHLKSQKIPFGSYSNRAELQGDERVILIDTMGELNHCYQIAKLAIVGGSFVDHVGGHNILEPVFFTTPVLFGPHMQAQEEFKNLALQSGAGLLVTLELLPKTVLSWLQDEKKRQQYIAGCHHLLTQVHGSTKRTLNALNIKCLIQVSK